LLARLVTCPPPPLRRRKTARRIKTPKGSENAPFETTPHGAPPRKTPRGASSLTSPKHICADKAPTRGQTAHDELENVTARVSHRTQLSLQGKACAPQGPRRPRFSFFRFNCQTAKPPRGQDLNPTARQTKIAPEREPAKRKSARRRIRQEKRIRRETGTPHGPAPKRQPKQGSKRGKPSPPRPSLAS
jgi:hypothetical protein